MILIVVPPLTTDSDLDRKIAATHRGMAHWAGTGPDGTTCGACEHFTPQRNHLAEGKCEKVLPGARKTRGNRHLFPASTASCRNFQSNTSEMDRGNDGACRDMRLGDFDTSASRTNTKSRIETNQEETEMKMNDAYPSKHMKAADLGGETVRAKIKHVEWETFGSGEDKPVMTFADSRWKPLVLNKINLQTCEEAFDIDYFDDWIGKEIEIYPTRVSDPAGRLVDGIGLRAVPTRKSDANVVPNTPTEPNPPAGSYAEELNDDIPFDPEMRR